MKVFKLGLKNVLTGDFVIFYLYFMILLFVQVYIFLDLFKKKMNKPLI